MKDSLSWSVKDNKKRCRLIDLSIKKELTKKQEKKLESLTERFLAYRNRVSPLPLEELRKMHKALSKKP